MDKLAAFIRVYGGDLANSNIEELKFRENPAIWFDQQAIIRCGRFKCDESNESAKPQRESYINKQTFKEPWKKFYSENKSSPPKQTDYAGPGPLDESVLGGSDYIESFIGKESPPIDEQALLKAVDCFNKKWGLSDGSKREATYPELPNIVVHSFDVTDTEGEVNRIGGDRFRVGDKVKVVRDSTESESPKYSCDNIYDSCKDEVFIVNGFDKDGCLICSSEQTNRYHVIPECCELIESKIPELKEGDRVVITHAGTDTMWEKAGLINYGIESFVGREVVIVYNMRNRLTIHIDGYDRNIIPTSCVSRLPE